MAILLAGTTAFSSIAHAQLKQETDDVALFEADFVTRKTTESPVIAEGNVKAYFGERFMTSDKVVYDPTTDIVMATGNVSITDTEGQTFFADEVELTGDLADGIATNFSAILADNSRLVGSSVIKTGDKQNELVNAMYTGCDICNENGDAKRPSWQVRALKVTQDKDNNVIRFNNAFFEVLGVPVIYSPYLQIPDPSVERQSGFLTPNFGTTTSQGLYLETPYYLAISDYQDATFKPKIMERQGVLLQGEYRIRRRRANAVLQAGIIDARDSEIIEQRINNIRVPNHRFHFFGEAKQNFLENWQAGFDVDHVSDKAYIKTYNVLPEGDLRSPSGVFRPDRLASNIYLNRRTEDSFFAFEVLGFQSLRRAEDNDFAAQALPRIRLNKKISDTPVIGGQTNFELNFLSLLRREGLDSFRAVFATQWDRVFTTSGGHRFKIYGEVRGDAYNYQDLDQGNEGCNDSVSRFLSPSVGLINSANANFQACLQGFPESGVRSASTKTRILPTVGTEWSYPLVRQTDRATIIIEPKVQLVVSTDNDFNDDIIANDGSLLVVPEIVNEDSQFFEFDTTSLFYWNKSSGYDLWENGQRANIGVSATAVFDNGFAVEGALGQQFRSDKTNIYTISGVDSGIGDTQSDIVGSLDMRWQKYFSFDNSFRFDKGNGTLRRAESAFRGRFGKLGTNVSYVNVQKSDTATDADEFLTTALSYEITDHWTVGGRWREDLTANKSTQQIVSLGYRDECSKVLLSYRIDNTNSDGFQFGDSLTINLELTGFSN